MYETNNNTPYPDYGVIESIINDKLVNINMGGEKDAQGNMVLLESVMVRSGYIPKVGDWVTINWENGQPIAVGGNSGSNSSGLTNINNDVKIVAPSDVASGLINADHIKAYSIQAVHISANAIVADAISAGSITTAKISANAVTADKIATNAITAQHISAGTINAGHISAGSIRGDMISAGTITAAQISSNTITAAKMVAGTITAASGILANAAITTAIIADGTITSAKIGNGEIKTANIASANITSALIQDLAVTDAKIQSISAGKISAGYISASLISAGSITGDKIAANTISGNHIAANTIDTLNLKAGSVTALKIAAGAITTDRLAANAITADKIAAGSITAEHITTVGLDAQLINVYDSKSGETLIGSGYLRVGGLDVGVVQSDNLVGNGLFLSSSSSYGFNRDNPSGEALLGSNTYLVGGSQIWKINSSTGEIVNYLDIPARKPVDIALDADGEFGYVTVEGDNTVVQLDLGNFVLTGKKLIMGMGPGVIRYTGDSLGDHKHFFVMNTDPMDMSIPDSIIVVDAPPMSINEDLYVHHKILMGNGPYDFVIDTGNALRVAYVTQANQGDIAIVDISESESIYWKVIGAIPIAAYGTDNYHGGLGGVFGMGAALGGDAAASYDSNISASYGGGGGGHAGHGGGGGHGGMDHGGMHGGSYGGGTSSLTQYTPRGIALSADSDTLYVVDYANGELVVVSKSGSAPYNTVTGRHDTEGGMPEHPGHGGGQSPAMSVTMGPESGGGQTTKYVRYRIAIGDEPDFIQVVNGKIYITVEGDNTVAVINESDIINAIEADRIFYATWNNDMPMNDYPDIPVTKIQVGASPSHMEVFGNNIFVSLSAQNQIAVINTTTGTIQSNFSVGPNPRGLAVSPDGAFLYVVNNGGNGNFSFVYPSGNYIGDPYIGLEGMVEYQGAEHWVPNRSNWVLDGSGNIKSSATVEFRINEPFLNEGGYVKLTATGTDYQYAMIEQDIYNAINYSNGNNMVVAVNEVLLAGSANTYFPRNEWINNPLPTFNIVSGNGSGGTVKVPANPSQYTIYYGTGYGSFVKFSGGVIPSGNWIESNYTARNNLYFKPHNGSIQIAVENSSSPNFATSFEIDEFVPKFITYDNLQTSSFTPTGNGINQIYSGLQYSVYTNRAKGKTVTSSTTPLTSDILKANFVGKIEGSTVENPHVMKRRNGIDSLQPPTGTFSENSDPQYVAVSTLNGLPYTSTTNTTNGYIAQQLMSFDLIALVERQYKTTIPGANTAAKITWLKANITKLTCNWHGFGGGPSGNKASLSAWNGSAWYATLNHTNSGVTKITRPLSTQGDMNLVIDANGFVHFLAYADASNGTIASHINTDYVELLVEVNTVAPSLSKITDGAEINTIMDRDSTTDPISLPSGGVVLPSGAQWVKVDLGKTYMIGKVSVSHAYSLDRVYQGTKTEVSEDGIIWTTVYDSSVSGTYNEKPRFVTHDGTSHTHYMKDITFDARPVRYIRDWANGWVSGDGLTSGATSTWTEIEAYGDWEVEYDYAYPENTEKAGQQLATNGKSVVSTDIKDAYVAIDLPIEFTTWWYMTYIVGPGYGMLKVEMPSMGMNHLLPLDYPYINKVAHRHIMPFQPSVNIKASGDVKAGQHRTVIRQASGKVTLDRFRFEDYQKFATNTVLIDSGAGATFARQRVIAEQAKWFIGTGNQSTEGAYDVQRTNPDSGLPDFSVPIKYRMRLKSELYPSGGSTERGIAYATSAIFETGKQHTHWRRSEAIDSYAGNRIERWDGNQPHKTGIQDFHLAAGAVRAEKILAGAIMDYHISPYAKIVESKLALNFPTHGHSNKAALDSFLGFSGSGVSDYAARADHSHDTQNDGRYLLLDGTNSMTDSLTTKGISFGQYKQYEKSYSVNISSPANLKDIDGNNLSPTKTYKAMGWTSGTGTPTSAISYFVGNGTSFTLKTAYRGGTNSNHINFLIDGSGIPAVSTWHANPYTVVVLVQEVPNDTMLAFGLEQAISLDSGATPTNFYFNGNMVWHSGNFVPSQYLTTSSASSTYATTATLTGNYMTSANISATYLPISGGTARNLALNYTDATPLTLRRNATDNESVTHSIGDGMYHMNYKNDEAGSEIRFTMDNSDMEMNGGANANTGFIRMASDKASGTRLYVNNNIVWHSGNFVPSNYYTTAQTYTQAQIDSKVAAAGDIRAASANVFTNTNTFTNAGQAIKIAPTSNVANGTKVFQVTDSATNDIFVIDASGNVTVRGNLVVSGNTVYQQATTISGNQTIVGQLTISGNTLLGATSTDVTTVSGTLVLASGTVFKQVGVEQLVARFPVYGIGGDLQLQIDSTTYESVTKHYWTFEAGGRSCIPAVPSGATRKYKLLVVYSTSGASSTGTLRIVQDGTSTELMAVTLPSVQGSVTGQSRTFISPAFTTSYANHTEFQAKTDVNGNILVIKYVEVIAYDVY
jgi:hypothetical protein